MKRKVNDLFLKGITYLASSLSITVLALIFWFVFRNGINGLDWRLLSSDYNSQNYLVTLVESQAGDNLFSDEENNELFFSKKWGIGVVDFVAADHNNYILVEKLTDDSPLNDLIDNQGERVELKVGSAIIRLNTVNKDGDIDFAGSQSGQTAQEFIDCLDKSVAIESIYFQNLGGGIRGALFATLCLILLSLVLSVPIGIATAIYLNEYARKNRVTAILKSSIETLSGIPSIIFGLMGVAVFYPVTVMMGADSLSIVLGGMTMSVILLPIVIRSTQEALAVIPLSLKEGSLALGASTSQTIFKICLPCALPGILSGVLLSVGRVIGESAALIYTMGTYINDQPQVLKPASSLAVMIWSIMSSEQPNFELATTISLVILVMVFFLNFMVKLISKKLSKAWY